MRLPFYTTLASSSVLCIGWRRGETTFLCLAVPAFAASLTFWSTEFASVLAADQLCLTLLLVYSFVRSLTGLTLREWLLVSAVLMVGAGCWAYKKVRAAACTARKEVHQTCATIRTTSIRTLRTCLLDRRAGAASRGAVASGMLPWSPWGIVFLPPYSWQTLRPSSWPLVVAFFHASQVHQQSLEPQQSDQVHAAFHLCFILGFAFMVSRWNDIDNKRHDDYHSDCDAVGRSSPSASRSAKP
jgi:hypothetical protein